MVHDEKYLTSFISEFSKSHLFQFLEKKTTKDIFYDPFKAIYFLATPASSEWLSTSSFQFIS